LIIVLPSSSSSQQHAPSLSLHLPKSFTFPASDGWETTEGHLHVTGALISALQISCWQGEELLLSSALLGRRWRDILGYKDRHFTVLQMKIEPELYVAMGIFFLAILLLFLYHYTNLVKYLKII
jgi:hypothetical protein